MKKSNLILSMAMLSAMALSSCGGSYKEIKIGDQVWMAENLNVDRFSNGDPIPHAKSEEEWRRAGQNRLPAWCYYDNDPKNGRKYGKLYNWYAVNDSRGLAPRGWRIPSGGDWDLLVDYLGGESVAGAKMKSKIGWAQDGNGTNESGFTSLPSGRRDYSGAFDYIGIFGYWWSATSSSSNDAGFRYMGYHYSNVVRNYNNKELGFSVRCLRD